MTTTIILVAALVALVIGLALSAHSIKKELRSQRAVLKAMGETLEQRCPDAIMESQLELIHQEYHQIMETLCNTDKETDPETLRGRIKYIRDVLLEVNARLFEMEYDVDRPIRNSLNYILCLLGDEEQQRKHGCPSFSLQAAFDCVNARTKETEGRVKRLSLIVEAIFADQIAAMGSVIRLAAKEEGVEL